MLNLRSIMNPAQTEETTLVKVISRIRSDETIKEIVERVRKAEDKVSRNEIKVKELPAFTLHHFSGAVVNDNFVSTKYIIFDIDGLDPTQLMTARCQAEQVSAFYFTTPSGKGIKFVIEFDEEMNLNEYRLNRAHNRKFFSDLFGAKLDDSYNALHTFYSYDPNCQEIPNHPIFTKLTVEQASRAEDINPVTCSDSEIADVCNYLCHHKLSYDQWMKVTMALQKVKGGKELYLMMAKFDTHEDHKHRDWEKKWDNIGKVQEITVGTLFGIAYQLGYRRKYSYLQDGQGGHNPFITDEDGMHYKPKDKPLIRCFGFKSIKILYQIFDPENGNKTVLNINDNEVKLPSQVFASPNEFRKNIQSKVMGSPFMITSSKANVYYDMLFDYLDKTKNQTCVGVYPGVGKVSDEENIWNFGSVILIDGNIVPYESLIIVNGKGYALEDNRHSLNIVYDDKALLRKLNLMHSFYNEYAATAIGWAVSNLFYDKITANGMNFPHLFLHGDSSSGKTALAKIILSMFGVLANKTTGFYLNIAAGSTANAVGRVKAGVCGIPNFFDEYTHYDNRDTKMYERLKSLYDNQGKTTAKKTNDNQIQSQQLGGGTIFASVQRDCDEQAALRCCYIDLSGIKDNIKERIDTFRTEFTTPNGLQELSSLAINVARSISYDVSRGKLTCWKEWHAIYMDKILANVAPGTDSRICNNLAVAAAGYAIIKPLLDKPVQEEWWAFDANNTRDMILGSSDTEIFLRFCYRCAIKGHHREFVKLEKATWEEESNLYYLTINVNAMMAEAAKESRMTGQHIGIDEAAMKKKLKASDNFETVTTIQTGSNRASALKLLYEVKE